MFLPGHRNVRTMRESELSRMEAKGVWVPMGAIILTHISTSLNNLLFMHVKSGVFEGVFKLENAGQASVTVVIKGADYQ